MVDTCGIVFRHGTCAHTQMHTLYRLPGNTGVTKSLLNSVIIDF
jgi:hypothetical protein